MTRISSPNDYIAAASSSETLEQIEAVVTAWVKQIEQVLFSYLVVIMILLIIFSHEVLLFILKADLERWVLFSSWFNRDKIGYA